MADSTTSITPAEIDRIAELASLNLTDEEKTTFVKQFGEILGYFRMIDRAPVSELADHDVDAADHLRDDVAEPSEVSPQQFSPYLERGHFKVPKVLE